MLQPLVVAAHQTLSLLLADVDLEPYEDDAAPLDSDVRKAYLLPGRKLHTRILDKAFFDYVEDAFLEHLGPMEVWRYWGSNHPKAMEILGHAHGSYVTAIIQGFQTWSKIRKQQMKNYPEAIKTIESMPNKLEWILYGGLLNRNSTTIRLPFPLPIMCPSVWAALVFHMQNLDAPTFEASL